MGFHEDHGAGSGEAAGAVLSRAADRAARTAGADRRLAGLLGASLSVTGDPGRGGDPGGPGGAAPPGVALVAVGGYGRCELLPGSDLDVLLLHDGRPDIGAIAGRIWYPLWDCGVRLDHAVRTVPQARRVARTDIRAALGLLYARHVAGEAGLTSRLRDGVLADWRAAAPSRIGELRDLHAQRAAFFGELAFLLEPDLKEARGGLRDVHAIQALAAAWAAPAPGPRVRAAYELILDVRHILHEVTGRPADRLLLQ